ncbi:MAG: TetR family transcriptional regulator [Hyphomonadaceae bacterium]|nr:TetR family transcriptional regulator [Hyphomonadaceae bacterium]
MAVAKSRLRKQQPAVRSRTPAPERSRTNDAERTRQDILEVAIHEMSEKGFSGARIDEIAERTQTSKRMIYYYFESKEGLYCAVLEECYRRIREIEGALHLKEKPPLEALSELVKFTFDHHVQNIDFIRLVMVENIHHGNHLAKVPALKEMNRPTIELLADICRRGAAEKVMRRNIDPVDLHMTISALCFFYVSNRYTFSYLFEVDMTSLSATVSRRERVSEVVLRYVRP